MYNRTSSSCGAPSPSSKQLVNGRRHSSPLSTAPVANKSKNVMNLNKFHNVPVQLHPGDTPGFPSQFAGAHPQSSVALLQEPFVDHRSVHAQMLLERISLLMESKDRAMSQVNAASDELATKTLHIMRASDAAMLPSMHHPGDMTHELFVRTSLEELQILQANVVTFVNLHRQCDANLKAAERELWTLSNSAELLLAAQDVDEERAYIGDTMVGRDSPGLESPHSRPLTPSTAAAAGTNSDLAAERAALERMNRESQHVALLDMALRVIRNPNSLWAKSDKGKEVIDKLSKLQSHYRAYRTRHRYHSLKRARRFLDRNTLTYQFYFFRRYVAAVRMDRLRLKKLGFYPLLGYSNLARLRRGAFILHATRARDNATLQRVFLLWRQLTLYQRAPLSTLSYASSAATPLPHHHSHGGPMDRRQSNAGAQRNMSRRWTVHQLQSVTKVPSALVPIAAAPPSTTTTPPPLPDVHALSEELSGIVSVASVASGDHVQFRTPSPALPPPWWRREAPFQYDLPEWDTFLSQEHLRKAMKRIALPVFGGSKNNLLMKAHVWKRWKEYVTLEKRSRATWVMSVQHERKQCKARHFMAWMDVVSFTAQKAAQCNAKMILYFGVWRRLVQRSQHERRATTALMPLKKIQVLNRWRQRVVRLRLQRAASNLLLFANRPIVLMCVHAMLDNRQQVAIIKLWRWWRQYTQRRRMFQSFVGIRWQKRSQQLARLVLLGWRGVVDAAKSGGSPVSRLTTAASPTTSTHGGGSSSLPSYVHASSVLFAPQTSDIGEDIRQLKQRASMLMLFRSYHAATAQLERLGPDAPVITVPGTGREGDQEVSFAYNPLELMIPGKECGPIPSLPTLGDVSKRDIGSYHAWFQAHNSTVTIMSPNHNNHSAGGRATSWGESEDFLDETTNGTSAAGGGGGAVYSWAEDASNMLQASKRCYKDKHFLMNVFHFALQKHKREKQAAAYRQLTTAPPTSSAAAVEQSTVDDAPTDSNSGVSSPTITTTAAAALVARQTLALSFVLGVGYPLASVASNEWNVTSMEKAFEDYLDYNLIIECKRKNRDGRIERKIDMRLAALRFADQNPFFTCYPLSVRNIGFSPYQALLDEYDLIVGGGKKARKASPKKKKSISGGDGAGSSSPTSSVGEKKRKSKYRIPLPPVPIRRQLPYLIRVNMESIVGEEVSQQRIAQQTYIRAKIQLVGILMKLRIQHANDGPRTLEAVHSREATVQRYTAAEEKNFVPTVVARKMQSLVAPDVAAKIERLPIDVQVLNITGFNPKFLRGTMQQKTRRIGLIRAAMKREGKWFHRTMASRCTLLPSAQWAMRRHDLEERLLHEEAIKEEKEEEDVEHEDEHENAELAGLLGPDLAPLRPLGLPFPDRLGKRRGPAHQLFEAAMTDEFASPLTNDGSNDGEGVHEDDESDDDEGADEANNGGNSIPWKPTRALSCVHLSEALAVQERNELWFRGVCAAPSSCPDSPLPRELILREPPVLEIEVELPVEPTPREESPPTVEDGAAGLEAAAGADGNPLTPTDGLLAFDEAAAATGDSAGFSPFLAQNEPEALSAGNLTLQLTNVTTGADDASHGGSTQASARSGAAAAAALLDDDFSTSDSDDDDPRMVAARKLKPDPSKNARTLAERTKSTRSVLGTQGAAPSLRKASVAREKSLGFVPPVDPEASGGASMRRDDEEEMIEPQPDATVDAFACAAMVNDGSQGATDGVPLGSDGNVNLAAIERPVAEELKEGVLKYTDGTYRIKDGSLVIPGPPVRLILATGESIDCPNTDPLMLAKGNIRLADGRIVPLGFAEVVEGQLKLQAHCMILADGTAVRLDGNAYRRDGKVRLASGRLVDAGRAAVGDDGRLMLASEKFLVQSGSSSDGSRRSKHSSKHSGGRSDDDTSSSSEEEKGLDAQYGLLSSRSVEHNAKGDGVPLPSSQHIKKGNASLFRHRRAPWTGGRVPNLWTHGASDPPTVPAVERLVEISARFNGYLNGTTRQEMAILKQFVMKALTKIDPDIAREEKEARQAARRLSSLRGLRHKTSAAGEGDDESEAAAAGLTVQPTEFRLTTPLAPPAPTVTIESARKRQPAASATVTRTNPTNTSSHGTTNTASDAAAGGSEGFQLPHSAPSHLGGGATKRYIPPAVLHGGLVSGESQMVVVDLLPARRDGTQFVRGEESSTMLVMKSTAELLNEARGPATLSDEVAEAVQRESATASAALEALFRKHPRKVVTTASLPPPPPPPLKEEGEKGPAAVAPPAPSPARLPQKLRTSVADSSTPTTIGASNMLQRPTSSTASSSSHIITPQANVASPSGDRAAFTQWLESLQRLQHNFATRDAATDTLRMHCDVLRRRVVNLQQDAPEGESEEVAAGRRHLLAEVRYRLDAVQELLSSPCPLQTTTELFDGAIQKRSFTGSANPRHRTPIDGAKRYGAASPTTTATTNEPVAPIKVTPPTEVVRADVTPLSDAEVGRLVGFLRKGVLPPQAAASKQKK